MDKVPYDFGLRLKELRLSRGLSQAAVASRLGIAKNTVSAYERNIKTPKVDTLVNLAVLYNSSVDYILGIDKRSNIYIDDVCESHQEIIIRMIASLKDALIQSTK